MTNATDVIFMAMGQQEGGYNNHAPRDQQAQLAGWGRRALAAHQNTIEAFPPFAAGVIISYLAKASLPGSTVLCLAFVAARIAYPILYIADHDKARSLVWGIGLLATVALVQFFGLLDKSEGNFAMVTR